MKKAMLILLALLVAIPVSAQTLTASAGSGTLTMWNKYKERATVAWTSTAGGAFTGTITGLQGEIQAVAFKPDIGSTSPTNNYDVTIEDEDGIDLLEARGANLSDTTATRKFVGISASNIIARAPLAGNLVIKVTNAGASNGGTIRLYFKVPTR